MGLYKQPGFEVSCDRCSAAGPARYSEDAAVEAAAEAGWKLAEDDGDAVTTQEDLCPACKVK